MNSRASSTLGEPRSTPAYSTCRKHPSVMTAVVARSMGGSANSTSAGGDDAYETTSERSPVPVAENDP